MNKILKDEANSFRGVFTEKTVTMESKSVVCTHNIILNFDAETSTHTSYGVHNERDLTLDIDLIVNQFKIHEVFRGISGQRHETFPNILLIMEDIRDYISYSLEKYCNTHFY